MFTCIACTKHMADEGGGRAAREEGGSGTPNSKEAVKSLTTQMKDIALKFSTAYLQCKPCTGSSTFKKGDRPYPDFDTVSEGIPYPFLGVASTSSTPAWDFTNGTHYPSTRTESRFGGGRTSAVSVSAESSDVVLEDEDETKEWVAQVEPGVHITFVSLPNGGNDLKRIRFSRDMFDKWQAQRWWAENYDRIMELYNVQRFNRQALHTPTRSDDGRDSSYSKVGSSLESPMMRAWTPRNHYKPPIPSGSNTYCPGKASEASSMDPSRPTTSSRDEASVSYSNASEVETEWVEQDESGVYITIRQLIDGTRELRRVRFSRERFGEIGAKTWWEENRERIQAQYL